MDSWFSQRFGKFVHLTHHAVERMRLRGISLDEVMELVEMGDLRYKNSEDLWLYRDFPHRTDNLVCAAAFERQAVIIKTLMVNWELEL